MTPEYDSGLAELQSVAEAKLDQRDQALLGAVRGVASYLRQPPPSDGSPPPPAAGEPGKDPAAATIALAEDALNRTATEIDAGGKGKP